MSGAQSANMNTLVDDTSIDGPQGYGPLTTGSTMKISKDVDDEVEVFKLDLRAACNKIMDNFTKYTFFVGHMNTHEQHIIMFFRMNNGSLLFTVSLSLSGISRF